MSKVEMTKIGVPNWLKNVKVLKQIDEINDGIEELMLSASTDTKSARQSLLDSAMSGTISALEFVERSSKIRNATTQSEIDVSTVKLLKAKKALAPKIKELATQASEIWEKKADEQEETIRGFLAKLDLRKAEEHAVLSTEQNLRRLRDTARSIKASGENFWTSSDSELLKTIEQRLRQTLGIFDANQY